MKEKLAVINNETGIHARPAGLIVKAAQKYKSDIFLVKNESEYNCKSIMNILSLAGKKGDEILIRAIGEDAEEAVEALSRLLEGNLDA